MYFRRTLSRLASLAALLALAAFLPAAVQAQDSGSEALPFFDRVDVDVVQVEVFVTDRSGQRIEGLERSDFEVLVDGQPVELSNFFVSREARPPAAPAGPLATGPDAASTEEPPAGTEAADAGMDGRSPLAEAPAPPAEPARRPLFLVVYVDNVNLTPSSRKRVLDDLRVLTAERAAVGDQVMIVGYDGGLQVVAPMTSDAEALDAAIDKVEKQATRRQIADANLRMSLQRIREGLANQVPGTIASEVARYRQEQLNDALGAYRTLHSVVRGLAGLPGRKAVLYVSEGIPRAPGAELAALATGGGPNLDSAESDLSNFYESIAEEANAHEITLYTLDARGSQSGFFSGADARGATDFGITADLEFTRDTNLQEPLLDMALYTGGQAILNTANLDGAFTEMVEDFQSFYSLGFPSPTGGDGEYHSIEVRVKRPGAQVRHRAGYLDKGRLERVADRTTSFLLQQWESNPMGVRLGFGEPKKKRKNWNVPLVVRIPASSLALLPRGNNSVGRVHLFVASQDDRGGLSEVTVVPRDVEVETALLEQARREGKVAGDVGYAVEVALRPGPASLVVGVLDEVGGSESYVFQKVVVGGPN